MNIIGKKAPAFYAQTTGGEIYFPKDAEGSWTVLYSYIGDFTSGAASDIMELDKKLAKFSSYNTKVYGISPDSVPSHIAFALSLRNQNKDGAPIGFDLISDRSLEISKSYGIENTSDDMNLMEKAVIIIDEDGIVRSFHKYSQGMGINVTEIERELLALQTGKYQYGATPAGWTPGDDIFENPPRSLKTAQSAIPDAEARGLYCLDWYICLRADSGLRSPSPTIGQNSL